MLAKIQRRIAARLRALNVLRRIERLEAEAERLEAAKVDRWKRDESFTG